MSVKPLVSCMVFVLSAALLLASFPQRERRGTGDSAKADAMEAEMRKIDNAGDHLLPTQKKPGPGGGEWDAHYRALFQDSNQAVSKGYPSHDEATTEILASSASGTDNLELHKYYTLFIMHYASRYRSHEGTMALRRLYRKLVHVQFEEDPPWSPSAPRRAASLPFEGDKRLTIHRDVVYGKTDPDFQNLDAYLVKSDRPTPVVMEIHGGGWRRGTKNQFMAYKGDLASKLIDAGISLVSIKYTLTTRRPMPAAMEDAARAVQFVRSKADEWNIDPERIAAMGGSAGAHISAWVALKDDLANPGSDDPIARQSTRLSCFVDFWGPIDMTRFDPVQMVRQGGRRLDMADAFEQALATSVYEYRTPEVQKTARAASPLYLVTPDDPPGLIFHQAPKTIDSPKHDPVPDIINDGHSFWFGVLLADELEKAGVEVVRHIGPSVGKDKEEDAKMVLAFLKKHLKVAYDLR